MWESGLMLGETFLEFWCWLSRLLPKTRWTRLVLLILAVSIWWYHALYTVIASNITAGFILASRVWVLIGAIFQNTREMRSISSGDARVQLSVGMDLHEDMPGFDCYFTSTKVRISQAVKQRVGKSSSWPYKSSSESIVWGEVVKMLDAPVTLAQPEISHPCKHQWIFLMSISRYIDTVRPEELPETKNLHDRSSNTHRRARHDADWQSTIGPYAKLVVGSSSPTVLCAQEWLAVPLCLGRHNFKFQ